MNYDEAFSEIRQTREGHAAARGYDVRKPMAEREAGSCMIREEPPKK